MPVDTVQIGERYRQEMGDVDALAENIKEVGLLHPIVVTPDNLLIAGARRLAAVKKLGWPNVPVTVLDLDEVARGEFAENTQRKDFTPSEVEAIRQALEPIEKAAAKERMRQAGKGAKVSQPSRASDKVGAAVGMSGRTVEKIAEVHRAAEAEPEKYGHLVEEMDRTRKVDGVYRKLRQARAKRTEVSPAPAKIARRRSRQIERAIVALSTMDVTPEVAAAELTGVDRAQLIASLKTACPWLSGLLDVLVGDKGHDAAAPGRTPARPTRSTSRGRSKRRAELTVQSSDLFDDDRYGDMGDEVAPKQLEEED